MIVILFGLRESGVDTAQAELISLGVDVTTYSAAKPLIEDKGDEFFSEPVLFVHLRRDEAERKARVGFVPFTHYSDLAEIVQLGSKYDSARMVEIVNNATVSTMTRAIMQQVSALQDYVDGVVFDLVDVQEFEATHFLGTFRPHVSLQIGETETDTISHCVLDNNRVGLKFDTPVTGKLRIRA